ncbi:MAG: NAD(P)H-dependent oxidoreductase [Anaerolineales bacterium]|nr:NAD(P)H-dependent oxidoreductase [Chloroflexota bacterium]MBL6980805.1 NAD(P)H-dependent oxidoreductase [Anaerolineales bacterium]
MRVVAISGSLRTTGYTRMALEIALEGAREVGAQTQMIYLNDYDLVFCDGRDKKDYPEGVHRLRTDVKNAQGIILGTPEYHGSYSGVLKNALDLMGFEEFGGKMWGLIGVAGGTLGATNALNSLRSIGRALHTWVVPEQVSISEAWNAFDEQGQPKEDQLRQRLMDVGRQVTRFAYLHTSEQMQEFLRLWEEAPENPGGSI